MMTGRETEKEMNGTAEEPGEEEADLAAAAELASAV
jgi:hypothetical protein